MQTDLSVDPQTSCLICTSWPLQQPPPRLFSLVSSPDLQPLQYIGS